MRLLAIAVMTGVAFPASADCTATATELVAAATKHLQGAHLCAPLTGEMNVALARQAMRNALTDTGLSQDQAVIMEREADEKAKEFAKKYDVLSLIKGDVTRTDTLRSCQDQLSKAYRDYELLRAKVRTKDC